MKDIRLRHTNRIDLSKTYSASLRGGVRGFPDAMALEPHSNEVTPTIKTITGFIVIVQIYEQD